MHFPLIFHLGRLPIHAHWIFESLAYFVGFRLYLHLRRTHGDAIHEETRWWLITAAALGAAAGSILLSTLESPSYFAAHWREPFLLLQGKTIVGALIGGWMAVELCKLRLHESRRTGDLFVLPLCIAMAIGRLGCFFTGASDHTFGAASSLPWAIDTGDGIRRHPLPLYEIAFLLLLAYLLSKLITPSCHPERSNAQRCAVEGPLSLPQNSPPSGATRSVAESKDSAPFRNSRLQTGDLFKLFMVAYMFWRFLTEFLKDREPIFLNLTAIQYACLAVLVFYTPDLWRWLHTSRRAPLTLAPGERLG